ncbi:hypothetical protein TNCV_4549401 [Trichonephila clavipes]|nr:hypothetical protein TNCV_4549401 [Trichonephila clavipes]
MSLLKVRRGGEVSKLRCQPSSVHAGRVSLWVCRRVSAPMVAVASDNDYSAVGLGSNPGEVMDACKCIVPLQHGGTLNSRRAASPLVRLVEDKKRWEASDKPKMFSL